MKTLTNTTSTIIKMLLNTEFYLSYYYSLGLPRFSFNCKFLKSASIFIDTLNAFVTRPIFRPIGVTLYSTTFRLLTLSPFIPKQKISRIGSKPFPSIAADKQQYKSRPRQNTVADSGRHHKNH